MDTEATKNIELARQNVRAAIKALSAVVVDQCVGTDEYRESFRHILAQSMNTLISVRESLG